MAKNRERIRIGVVSSLRAPEGAGREVEGANGSGTTGGRASTGDVSCPAGVVKLGLRGDTSDDAPEEVVVAAALTTGARGAQAMADAQDTRRRGVTRRSFPGEMTVVTGQGPRAPLGNRTHLRDHRANPRSPIQPPPDDED
ncbi:MAG: hypothetical protein QM820_41870 [Minicystis sp.]